MKSILQKIIFNTIAIAAVAYIAPGLSYGASLKTLFLAAFALAFINSFIRPLIKILLLPINIITLGLSGWLINVVILYLATLIVPEFSVTGFTLSLFGTDIILSTFWAFIVVSFMLNIASSLINWLLR